MSLLFLYLSPNNGGINMEESAKKIKELKKHIEKEALELWNKGISLSVIRVQMIDTEKGMEAECRIECHF